MDSDWDLGSCGVHVVEHLPLLIPTDSPSLKTSITSFPSCELHAIDHCYLMFELNLPGLISLWWCPLWSWIFCTLSCKNGRINKPRRKYQIFGWKKELTLAALTSLSSLRTRRWLASSSWRSQRGCGGGEREHRWLKLGPAKINVDEEDHSRKINTRIS